MLNTAAAIARLGYVRHMLVAAGWTTDGDDGWLAPEHIRDETAMQYGRGHLHVWDAINAQTRFDLFILHAAQVAA